jgi:hypothetical protein
MILLSLLSCSLDLLYNPLFDEPSRASILPSTEETGWKSSLGFIANRRSGKIVPLDLERNSAFSDQFSAPFLRPRGVATGAGRSLEDLVAFAPSNDRISLYALDTRSQKLLQVPYIEEMLPEPQLITPTASEINFVDSDQSGDSPTLQDLKLQTGATTTEDWTITYQRGEWLVQGSRSALQEFQATTGTEYISGQEEIQFTISGTASEGDYFEFSTETGLVEHDLGGTPLEMLSISDPFLLISVFDTETSRSWLSLFNMIQNQEIGRWEAPEGVQLGRMAQQDETIFITDTQNPQIIEFSITLDDFAASTAETISAISVVHDLEILETQTYSHLFAALATEQRIDVFDLDTREWKQVNPYEELRGGTRLYSPVVGISKTPRAIQLQSTSDFNAPEIDHAIIASLFDGTVVMLEGETGCVATIPGGSSIDISGISFGTIEFKDTGVLSNPEVYVNDAGMMLSTSNCGGVLLDEDWTVLYNGTTGYWTVEGSRSGEQETLAHLDKRYRSDNGAFSFLLLSGNYPATDGDFFTFSTRANTLSLQSVLLPSGTRSEALELPAPPEVYQKFESGDDGWIDLDGEVYALIPISNSDTVIRLNLETWATEMVWN